MVQNSDRPPLLRLKTPKFRVSFPAVFHPKAFGKNAPKYSLTAIIYRAMFDKEDQERMAALEAALMEQMTWLHKGFYVGMPNVRWPIRSGIEPDRVGMMGYGPGSEFFAMSCDVDPNLPKPQVIGYNRQPIAEADFYPGCWAIATVLPFAYHNEGRGGGFILGNVQKVREDGQFGAVRVAAEDEFDDVPFDGQSGPPQFQAGASIVPPPPAYSLPAGQPQYNPAVPQYQQPAPLAAPQYQQPVPPVVPQYPQPAPQYPQPAPQYPQPAPQYPQPVSQYQSSDQSNWQ